MKAIIVVDIPHIQEPCEIDELGLVADMHIRPTTLCSYEPFDLKEVDVRPMPEPKYVEVNEIEDLMHTEFSIENLSAKIRLDTDKLISLGWNACLMELEDSQNGEDSNE